MINLRDLTSCILGITLIIQCISSFVVMGRLKAAETKLEQLESRQPAKGQ